MTASPRFDAKLRGVLLAVILVNISMKQREVGRLAVEPSDRSPSEALDRENLVRNLRVPQRVATPRGKSRPAIAAAWSLSESKRDSNVTPAASSVVSQQCVQLLLRQQAGLAQCPSLLL